MATAMYLEHCLDSLESLPNELQRNFNLMRDLDTRTQELLLEIDKLSESYLTNARKFSTEERSEKVDQIHKMFSKSKQYGDEKVQLANQTYEMVDKHIRRLDSDLARFEAEVRSSAQSRQNNDDSPSSETKKSDKISKKKRKNTDNDDKKLKKKKNKGQNFSPEIDGSPNSTDPSPPPVQSLPILSLAGDVLDMPVDPNEPTYCVCHQVSYGEMIGCDNPDCPVEWFHFGCVGLTSKPKGKWYCQRCNEERKRKHGTSSSGVDR